jgi:hypothetical protein
VLTDAGKEAVRQAWPVYAQAIGRYFAPHMSEEEARIVRDVFSRVAKVARQDNQ